ncbi:hypothetical protein [Phycisphaera mikurensis]|uniref:Uncharacterized protein n=1 Tax=Phycisphaera mikurensis (strain NBRC 102666 / KCTC 22515 / FYK2301M01) TaxID=1142394 RepID=I0IAD0_PHYMF|nr:hypothetical protein [Phycisphaera mikurensis]MBB6441783.1 hypothetical protein [Phycisphaera mikurensis]BAM02218.1 hypothetical protein PSMK_00590 [Phycisphaera mikurensis NBRC 102666]
MASSGFLLQSQQDEGVQLKAGAVLLEHARFAWAAEEERARLIQRELQLSVGLLVAATGAVFTAAVTLLPRIGGPAFFGAVVLLTLSLVAAGLAFAKLVFGAFPKRWPRRCWAWCGTMRCRLRVLFLWRPRQDPPLRRMIAESCGPQPPAAGDDGAVNSASGHLRLPVELLRIDTEDELTSLKLSYEAVSAAFLNLQARNDELLAKTRASGGAMVYALVLGVAGILLAIVSQGGAQAVAPATLSVEETRHEREEQPA